MWGPGEWTAAATVANAVLVVVLVGATIYYARKTNELVAEQRLDRAATFLPLFHWQSPRAACGVSSTDMGVIRRQLNIVLWNIGNGAARVTLATAWNIEDTGYRIAHFDTPSIVPAHEQLSLRVFRDQTEEEILQKNDCNFLRDEEITVSFHYSDVVERRHYETHVLVRCHFADARDGKMRVIPTPPEPPEGLSGFEVRAVLAFADPRTAQERIVDNCELCEHL